MSGGEILMIEACMVERHGDMTRLAKLRLRTDVDGDIHVVCDGVDQITGRPSVVSVEFVRPGLGGGRSPRVVEALLALMSAIRLDNELSPFDHEGRNEKETTKSA